jgi:aromatic-L-amino-acid/L-tryptophan decarboxylase
LSGNTKRVEETLDPENWDELRALGHKMLDDMIDYQKKIDSLPFNWPTQEATADICVPLPEKGDGVTEVYDVFNRSIRPYIMKSTGSRFWGAVVGSGSTYGMYASMLTSGLNQLAEARISTGLVHKQVINWIKDMLDYPQEAGGVLVSGGSEANFTALAVARNTYAEVDMKTEGMQGVPRKMRIYVSDGGHHCLERSIELLVLGEETCVGSQPTITTE